VVERRHVVQVRRLRAGEGDRLRELRLRALRADPYAFYATLASEEFAPPEHWERQARASESAATQVTFVADRDGESVGIAIGLLPADRPATARVEAMWVAPGARRLGLGRALLEAVMAWARERGALRLELAVSERSAAAQALYRDAGFAPTGERRRVASDPAQTGVLMSRSL
jgi:ribosomal protein S18 acetylase RimI-like enzyme